MNIKAEDLQRLDPRFRKAFESMQALEAGSIANQDENRQVGHYWLRNPDLSPKKEIGESIAQEIKEIQNFSKEISNGNICSPNGSSFTDVLWIGIGGSSLGPLFMVRALQQLGKGLSFHFLDNVDPEGINTTLTSLGKKLHSTLFVVVSKSGGTPEPRIGMAIARHRLEEAGGEWCSQSVAITMINSQLDNQAKKENWIKRFDLPDWVGGRTSITSAVGLLPAALSGIDVEQFLKGASEMDDLTRDFRILKNPSALLTAAWLIAGEEKGLRDMVILPYRDRLELFSRYLQQLVMESLGKRFNREGNIVNQGLSVFGNKGSTDQHAYVQQLRDGIDNFFAIFIEVLEDTKEIPEIDNLNSGNYLSGFLQGTRKALTEGCRQNATISMKTLDARSLGALIALFERSVGLYAEIVNINAYDQPGVEAGKKAASEVLTLQEKVETLLSDGEIRTIEEIQISISEQSAESLFWILRHLVHNNSNFFALGDWGNPLELKFGKK